MYIVYLTTSAISYGKLLELSSKLGFCRAWAEGEHWALNIAVLAVVVEEEKLVVDVRESV